jgi:hypothetical protein
VGARVTVHAHTSMQTRALISKPRSMRGHVMYLVLRVDKRCLGGMQEVGSLQKLCWKAV